ncbi:hypothetical protein CAPTEDRAFT_157319 [Capitella teleta]|uniref:Protein CNPPD1 n=1 Tax=Capitella teleta TaxID=283909 RepID=R7TUM3_CAPTE|nr:hypothetical protein CAPTEDRAFT_157319 [Capitella teleta]|eukprot:ELT97618.1 hypothetical protein CAPTEDRAFT_157319 [Capitella teleta]
MDWASLVSRQAAVSPCALLLALVYIERLRHRNPEYLQEVSSSDLFLVSMMVASKFLYDEGVTEEVFNDEWAQAANIDVSDLNEMERTFLYAMDWQLFVNGGEFWTVLNQVERWISRKAGVTYGLLSYLDLSLLSEAPKFQQNTSECLRTLSQVMMVCSLAYVASVSILAFTPAALTSVHSGLQHTQHILNDLSAQDWILPLPASPLLDFPEPSSNESETPRSVSAVSGLLALSLLTACVDTPCGQQRERSPVLNPQMPDVVNERLGFHGYEDPDVMMNNDVNQVVIQRPQSIEGLVPNWRKCDFGEVLGWQKGLQVLNHAVTC